VNWNSSLGRQALKSKGPAKRMLEKCDRFSFMCFELKSEELLKNGHEWRGLASEICLEKL
ncbi:MAG: hypothetical protein ACOVNZ_02840, partial [Crocinitomicaceae bacterium]